MKIYQDLPESQWQSLCRRPVRAAQDLEPLVADVFRRVEREGDPALLAYTEQFDNVSLASLLPDDAEIKAAAKRLPKRLKQAIDTAYENIVTFHKAQQASVRPVVVETQPGVRCWREPRPIDRVGLYVPGGTAPLFSTVLMLGVPAQLAGCREVILCTPPRPDGSLDLAIGYAAQLVGVSKIITVGGVQAIAALAIGTNGVPRVDKIFGPGNQYVTAAKVYAARFGVAMDMPAGPSEVMVIADDAARPDFVAADLLSQAEHGRDSQAVLLATRESIAAAVRAELTRQLARLPRRELATASLANSFCLIVKGVDQAVAFANLYAPEHLLLSVADPEAAGRLVRNAGSVFLGNFSPESAGDYASGTNHTLPTNGWARSYGGLSLESFCKYVTFQSLTRQGAAGLAPTVVAMAEAEGLQAHQRAMEIRR